LWQIKYTFAAAFFASRNEMTIRALLIERRTATRFNRHIPISEYVGWVQPTALR